MKQLLGSLLICSILLTVSASATQTVFKIFEQEEDGDTTHRLLDRSTIGDGLDPVLQFILLEEPTDPKTAQVLWEASESPIHWVRSAEEVSYRMIEHAALPDGSLVEYRIYAQASGNELVALRHMRREEDGNYAVDDQIIDQLPDGEYNLHAYLLLPDRPKAVLMQRVSVAEDGQADGDESEPEESGPATLEPGDGFTGPTPQPAAIGNKTTMAISRWDVVPEQAFEGLFEVGVLAFHSYGIDRVELSFNGGAWVSITEPTVNPRTGVKQYWAQIDARDVKDGRVELRAVAYPKSGIPRVLEPLTLFANSRGSVDIPVLELDAGAHVIPHDLKLPKEGWFIIRPKPGISKEQCILYNIGRNDGGNLKVEGVTIKAGPSSRGPGRGGKLWMDNVDYIGVDANKTDGTLTWWMSDHQWAAKYHTNMSIRQLQTAFHTCDNGIIRNVTLDSVYEDVFRQAGLIANVKVKNLAAAKKHFHPDVFQWYNRTPTNMIVYNVTAERVSGQGLFSGNLKDCAFVNLDINTIGQYRPLQMQGTTSNVLIQDSRFVGELHGILRYDKGFRPKDMVLRNVNASPKDPGPPIGWKSSEISIYPQPAEE